MRNFRSGLTVVELIICVGFCSLLVAISIPAIQQQREAARNEVCKSNLVEIGQAALEYDVVNGQLPPYLGLPFNPTTADQFFDASLNYQLTYSTVQLLPFVDELKLVDLLDPFAFEISSDTIFDAGYPGWNGWLNGVDADLPGIAAVFYRNQVPVFRCPADNTALITEILFAQHPSDVGAIGTWQVPNRPGLSDSATFGPRTSINYVSNGGAVAVTTTPTNPEFIGHWGPIRSRESDTIDSIADGAAQVIMFAESLGNINPVSTVLNNARVSGMGGLAIGRADIYGLTDGANPFPFLGTAEKSHWIQFGAPHPDVINTLRADGTVQPFNRNIQPETFGRLCGAADGEPLFDSRR